MSASNNEIWNAAELLTEWDANGLRYKLLEVPRMAIDEDEDEANAHLLIGIDSGKVRRVDVLLDVAYGREISDIDRLLRRNLLHSAAVASFFLLASLPFILLLAHVYRAHTADLKRLNAELRAHKDTLEIQVQERTADLRKETERLQEALANVRTLSGLIPICAHCKKIRDDKGYWNQLELYIQQNSDALFSHGLCPDCVRQLYPEFANADELVPPSPPAGAPPPSA